MIKFGVILNPTSGKGKGAILGPKFVEELQKLGVEVLELTGANYQEATENGRKAVAAGSIDALAVAGGDGMVHLGLNLCAGTSMPLAMMPCGTGNDAAMTLGIPIDDPAAAAALAVETLPKPVSVDLGLGSPRLVVFTSSILHPRALMPSSIAVQIAGSIQRVHLATRWQCWLNS